MATLTLRYKEKTISEYKLISGKNLSIGRNTDNDIVINNAAVSGNHARIESVASNFIIRDLNSTNGVFVNKQRVEVHALHHEDIVLIGKHELVFGVFESLDAGAITQETKDRTNGDTFFEDKTRFLDTSDHRELIRQTTGRDIADSAKPATTRNNPEKKKGLLSKLLEKIFG